MSSKKAFHSMAKTIILNHIHAFESKKSKLEPGRYSTSNRRPGRPRVLSQSYVLDRILYLLQTGCQWSHLPVVNGTWHAIYSYYSIWTKENLFKHAYNDLLRVYRKIKPRSNIKIIDTSFVKNVFGSDCVGRSPVDRGRQASKVSIITDEHGIPLTLTFHKGNRNDCKTLKHALSQCQFLSPGDRLYADKIYDTKECRELLSSYSLENCISKKKQPVKKGENKIRIRVEHTFGWLDKYRRIILRYESKVSSFISMHYLACLHLVGHRLPNE